MSVSPRGFSLLLKMFAVLSDQQNCLALLVAGQFFFSIWRADGIVEER